VLEQLDDKKTPAPPEGSRQDTNPRGGGVRRDSVPESSDGLSRRPGVSPWVPTPEGSDIESLTSCWVMLPSYLFGSKTSSKRRPVQVPTRRAFRILFKTTSEHSEHARESAAEHAEHDRHTCTPQ